MRSIDIWRTGNGEFVEHWDELNLLDVFQQIADPSARRVDRRTDAPPVQRRTRLRQRNLRILSGSVGIPAG